MPAHSVPLGTVVYMITAPQTGQTLLYSTKDKAADAAAYFERLLGYPFETTPLTLH